MTRTFMPAVVTLALLAAWAYQATPTATAPSGSGPGQEEPSTGPMYRPSQTSAIPRSEPSVAVRLAKADLARRLGIEAKSTDVLEVEDVMWPDANLGCLFPNARHAQVITPGLRWELAAEGQKHQNHSDTGLITVPRYRGPFTSAPQPVDVPGLETPSENICRFCD